MKLTRKLVLSRAKASEIESVRKLNCWGSRLSDIALCREMPNIEVITLSVNQIASLQPLSQCQNLTELYLRKNNIQSMHELCHLQGLPCLRVLWLAENPCCGPDPRKYRMTVLRALPSLQKLDNQTVTEEELAQAKEEGGLLLPPPSASTGNDGCHPAPADTDSDLLSFSMEETNKIREQLGMKPLSRNKFSSFSSPRETGDGTWKKEGDNILSAILLLLQELDRDGLQAVHQTAGDMLKVLQPNGLPEEGHEEEA
ncbi:cilia- and flagella-associated protein 410 [Ambystoma mexicanum]|uniref:cilia- and flagella-associated protein 410 n=1 Tax=Ambystoma mexicanum TaxID=8296 RepID=UPI0037E71ACB